MAEPGSQEPRNLPGHPRADAKTREVSGFMGSKGEFA